jgi:hypothetical protein
MWKLRAVLAVGVRVEVLYMPAAEAARREGPSEERREAILMPGYLIDEMR